ncbi:MAG: VirB3 family type IV secretion system protein [Candidatus Thiodiazotropha lotti]|nr:VirB3 family type IV secretion system protein [Candidatus Thiodiazotropha lotti]
MEKRRSNRIYPVLNRPKLIAGVEDSFAIANITVGLTMVMHFQQWQLIPVFLLFHLALSAAGRREPAIRKVYRRYAGQGDCYEPFPRNMGAKMRNARPEGWGRGVPC